MFDYGNPCSVLILYRILEYYSNVTCSVLFLLIEFVSRWRGLCSLMQQLITGKQGCIPRSRPEYRNIFLHTRGSVVFVVFVLYVSTNKRL